LRRLCAATPDAVETWSALALKLLAIDGEMGGRAAVVLAFPLPQPLHPQGAPFPLQSELNFSSCSDPQELQPERFFSGKATPDNDVTGILTGPSNPTIGFFISAFRALPAATKANRGAASLRDVATAGWYESALGNLLRRVDCAIVGFAVAESADFAFSGVRSVLPSPIAFF
jgi:hypothetical protein